jgi:hypothetical protein
MTNRYRVRLPVKVDLPDGRSFTQGDEFEYDLSPEDELWYLDDEHHLLEIVPRRYRVIGESVVDGAAPGEVFEAAMTLAREELLLGSHVKHVDSDSKLKAEAEAANPAEPDPPKARRRRTSKPTKE